MKLLFGRHLASLTTLLMLSFSPSFADAMQPELSGLVALVCEPVAGVRYTEQKVIKRKRFIFMNKDDLGEVKLLCVDEVGTNGVSPTTCTKALSGSALVEAAFSDYASRADYESVKIRRSDASMTARVKFYESPTWRYRNHEYACTPAKDPKKILDFVKSEKRKQRSSNAF